MKAVEFPSELGPNQTLSVPAGVAVQIPQGRAVRVLVLIADDADETAWEQLAATDLGQGYADSDAIYDHLSGR